MGADRRPKAGLERPTIAGGGFNVLSVERHFRPVVVRHNVDFIPVHRVKEECFEGKRIVGKPIRCLELFNRTAAS